MQGNLRLSCLSIAAVVLMLIFGGGTAQAAACAVPVPYATIQDAVNDVTCDPINVAAGVYLEQVSVFRAVTLNGAQAGIDARTRVGAESTIDHPCGPVQITAANVILNGFTARGADFGICPGGFNSGIWTAGGTAGGQQILNNIIENNPIGLVPASTGGTLVTVSQNLFRNNNKVVAPAGGSGIYTDFGLANALIDNNTFVGNPNVSMNIIFGSSPITISNNLLDSDGGIALFLSSGVTITGNTSTGSPSSAIYIGGANSGVTVSSNRLLFGVEGITVADAFGVGANSGVVANGNCIQGNSTSGLMVASGAYAGGPGSLDATSNWWGAGTGPTIASNPGGAGDKIIDPALVVDFTPFLIAPAPACDVVSPSGSDFRDKRRGNDINLGNDLRTGPPALPHFIALNFTGAAGPAGDTWVTVYDPTPLVPAPPTIFTGSISLSADVLMANQNNAKGAGLLALYNQPPPAGSKGLALFVIENGGSDRLVLATVTGTPLNPPPGAASAPVILATKALGAGILVNKWYRVTMDVVVTGGSFSVTGKVFTHTDPLDPNSPVLAQVDGSLVFPLTTLASKGLTDSGEVGIAATATSAIVNSSVLNFLIIP